MQHFTLLHRVTKLRRLSHSTSLPAIICDDRNLHGQRSAAIELSETVLAVICFQKCGTVSCRDPLCFCAAYNSLSLSHSIASFSEISCCMPLGMRLLYSRFSRQ
jgi:hypothetical protein